TGPSKSWMPSGVASAGFPPTAEYRGFFATTASPQGYVLPEFALAANSHSASVGTRQVRPVVAETHSQNAMAPSNETARTANCSRPAFAAKPEGSSFMSLRSVRFSVNSARKPRRVRNSQYSATVIGYFPIQNSETETACSGLASAQTVHGLG